MPRPPGSGEFKTGDKVHVYSGLQSSPALVTKISQDGKELESTKSAAKYKIQVKTDKELAFSPGDLFLLSKLEDPKQRFLASGTP
jgi:hypothetical protein